MKTIHYILLLLVSTAWANPLLEKANELYRKEKYEEAITVYETILKGKQQSVALYYNLGNAHYKLHHIAPAIYNYEKALLLDPSDEEVQTNLQFAKAMTIDEIKAVPQVGFTKLIREFTGMFHFNTWAWISVFLSFSSVLFFVGYYFSGITSLKRIFFIGMFTLIGFLGLSFIAALLEKNHYDTEQPAIVFANTAPVKNEPKDNAEDTFILHEGTKVNCIETYSEWSKISLSDGTEGWINTKSIRAIK